MNEWRTLTKHVSRKCECKFNSKKCNLNEKRNNNKCRCKYENAKEDCVKEKGYFWNPAICSCKNGKYAGSIDDSIVMRDEIIDTTKSSSKKNYSNQNCSDII